MRISKLEVNLLTLPLASAFSISSGVVHSKDAVIVKVFTQDGRVGYGESSTFTDPVFTGETSKGVVYALCKLLAPRIIGKDFESPGDFVAAYNDIVGHNAAKHGLESAFWHVYSLYADKSLSTLFNGVKTHISVGESIGLKNSIAETIEEVEKRLSEGYQRIKLKIQPGWDITVVEAVRRKWPDIKLSVDANTAYTLDEHVEVMTILDSYDLSMIEQPFGAKNLLDHAALQKVIKTPICLDESIQNLADLKASLMVGACKIVNIKPVRVGGIVESIKIHDYAASHGVAVWCGGMLETGIGRAFNIALASKKGFTHPADMSPPKVFYLEDLIDPTFTVDNNGTIVVPTTPGLGYNVRNDLIEKYTVDRFVG